MGRPGQFRTFDAFTPTGSGKRFRDEFPPHDVPEHRPHYVGTPAYMTGAEQRAKLRKKGDV